MILTWMASCEWNDFRTATDCNQFQWPQSAELFMFYCRILITNTIMFEICMCSKIYCWRYGERAGLMWDTFLFMLMWAHTWVVFFEIIQSWLIIFLHAIVAWTGVRFWFRHSCNRLIGSWSKGRLKLPSSYLSQQGLKFILMVVAFIRHYWWT